MTKESQLSPARVKGSICWGAWVAQLGVKLLVSARVMISQFVDLSPASGSVLTAQSLLGILPLPLSLPFPCCHALWHLLSLKINELKKKKKR